MRHSSSVQHDHWCTMNSNQVLFSSQSELRGVQLFRAISKKLGRRRRADYEEDSTDSDRSISGSSSSGSESNRSSESLRKMFQSLSLGSHSSAETKSEPQKRILRQPVSYTYVRGLSGLPTIRVPRNSACCPHSR